MTSARGGVIFAVRPGSVGSELGLEPGDRLVSINEHVLRDVIDYRYYSAEEELVLVVERAGECHRLEVERDYDEDLGLEFAEPLFDGLRRCNNRCPFCFVAQMPRGLRRALYVHDDDYRYSFLLGNFVTLTNLSPQDWQRIEEQHLSPLYVSIHATDLGVRRRILGNPRAPDITAQLRRLGEMGIVVHGQIVISPGVNDGAALKQSIDDLSALWPTIQTLALVPVGLTRFHRGDVRLLRPDEAAAILDMAATYQGSFRERYGYTWLYPSDELYLLANRAIPKRRFYDDEAQRENGVGLVRSLLDDWARTKRALRKQGGVRGEGQPITLVCGTLIAPTLQGIAAEMGALTGDDVQVVPVVNRFFGESVTISGLLTGEDVLATLAGRDLGERVFLPRAMFDSAGLVTLDDLTLEALCARLATPISVASTAREVFAALTR
jgi:putative radical SAM enzyme (TIGR03279 family)